MAEITIHGEVSLPTRSCLSLFARCQIEAESLNLSRLSYIQTCSLEVTYGRMDSQATLDHKEQEVVSHTAEVP